MSNPYSYPANPTFTAADVVESSETFDPAKHLDHPISDRRDPEMIKLSSVFWKSTGLIQSAVGGLTGIETWKEMGQTTQEWADLSYKEAQAREHEGQASWVHGEYNRWRGMFGTVIGHVTGNHDMESKARQRTKEGDEELGRWRR